MKRVRELLEHWSLNEYVWSAPRKAAALGLTNASFGNWKDATGKVTHKTVDDRLVKISTKKPDSLKTLVTTLSKRMQTVDMPKVTSKFKPLVDAVTLWESDGGYCPMLRGSEDIDDHSEIYETNSKFSGPGGEEPYYRVPASRKNLEVAKDVMTKLASLSVAKSPPVYRGLTLSLEEADAMKVGASIDLGTVASFTTDESIGIHFMEGADGEMPVLFTVPKNKVKRGCDIDPFSTHGEEEFVTSGKFKVTSAAMEKGHNGSIEYNYLSVGIEAQ